MKIINGCEKLGGIWDYRKVGGHFKKQQTRNSGDYEIYLRHMKNTTGTPKERWKRVRNTLIDPMVVLATFNGFWLCDGGFYAQSFFKTAIAKPVLCVVVVI